MSFESSINALKEELNLKYPVMKNEEIQKVTSEDRRLELIRKIESVVEKIIKNLGNDQFSFFKSAFNVTWEDSVFDGRLKVREGKERRKRIDFRRQNSRADFAGIVFLLSKTHKLLMSQQTSTRRELYYENLKIFKTQKQVDNGMREVCHLLNAPTWELRVSAASKGIVAGPLVLILPNGESVDCEKRGGVSIPQNVSQIEKMSSSASWVLIVEKEACFQKLVEATDKLACILITGKGFPDVNSRILVCKFWEILQIPILALVDADPHGFEIMCVYRFGSLVSHSLVSQPLLSMSSYSGHLACPAVRWLGIHPSDIRPLFLDSRALSARDQRKIELLLRRRYVEEEENLRSQLKILLEGNVKAEIEGLSGVSDNFLTNVYLRNKIQGNEYL